MPTSPTCPDRNQHREKGFIPDFSYGISGRSRPLTRRQALRLIGAAGGVVLGSHTNTVRAQETSLPRKTKQGIVYHYHEPYDYGVDPAKIDWTFARNPRERSRVLQHWPQFYEKQLGARVDCISHGNGPKVFLPVQIRDIGGIAISDGQGVKTTIGQYLRDDHTDEFLVVHNNQIVSWQEFCGMKPTYHHAFYSLSKSVAGDLVGILIGQGKVRETDKLSDLVPDLRGTAYQDVTVRHGLDMKSGVGFFLDTDRQVPGLDGFMRGDTDRERRYLNASNTFHGYSGMFPKGRGESAEAGQIDFVRTLTVETPPGEVFMYKCIDVWALGRVVEEVTGKTYAQAVSDHLWSRTGARSDAFVQCDAKGSANAAGGLAGTGYDTMLWGLLHLNGGRNIRGEQVLPESFVADTCGSTSYRNLWWYGGAEGAILGSGAWGQHLFLKRRTDGGNTAILKFSSYDYTKPPPVGTHLMLNQIADKVAELY